MTDFVGKSRNVFGQNGGNGLFLAPILVGVIAFYIVLYQLGYEFVKSLLLIDAQVAAKADV